MERVFGWQTFYLLAEELGEILGCSARLAEFTLVREFPVFDALFQRRWCLGDQTGCRGPIALRSYLVGEEAEIEAHRTPANQGARV